MSISAQEQKQFALRSALDRLRPVISAALPPLDAGIDLANEMRRLNTTRDPTVAPTDGWARRRLKDVKKTVHRHLLWQEVQFNHLATDAVRRLLMKAHSETVPARELLVLVPYDIADHTTGGASRLYGLARHLGRHWRIRMITMVSANREPEMIPLYPQVELYCVPKSMAFEKRIESMRPEFGAAANLLAMEEGWKDLPLLTFWTGQFARSADAIFVDGPPLLNLWREAGREKPIVFESPNVYPRLLRMLGGESTPQAAAAERAGSRLESDMVRAARFTVCVTEDDRASILNRNKLDPHRVMVVPNGVECARSLCFTPADTARAKLLGGLAHPIVLFLGSNHLPNLEAVDFLHRAVLPAHPDVWFVFAGVTVEAFERVRGALPRLGNAVFLGKLSETDKESVLALSDLALCPVESGSGSSLKVPDYAAHGKPVLSTEFGLRGFDALKPVVRIARLSDFAKGLSESLAELKQNPDEVEAQCLEGRRVVERTLDWSVVTPSLDAALSALAGRPE